MPGTASRCCKKIRGIISASSKTSVSNVILAAAQRLYETGSILPKKNDCGRQRNQRNVGTVETVLRAVEQEPETSIQVIAQEHNLSYSTVQRILKEEEMHAYHYTRVQDLRKEDYQRRKIL